MTNNDTEMRLSGHTGRILALEQKVRDIEAELYRVRTTQSAAAHALDTLRQQFGLDLVDGEHPMDTATRIVREAVT